MNDLTARDISKLFNVDKRVAQGWIQRGLFPNAYKEETPFLGEVWRVPIKDLENFVQPQAGRPKQKAA